VRIQWLARFSAHRFLYERADSCLYAGGQLGQCEVGRPHGAVVEVRLVAEAERTFIAARYSSVNPEDLLPTAVVLLADFCVSFIARSFPYQS
jgi:hypothetical protein